MRLTGTNWLCVLLVIMAPINSFAGGSDFTFNPSSVNLAAVIGETDSQDVRITNVSGKAITISSITQEFGPGEFSEISNCLTEMKAGASCTMKVSFAPTHGGGRNGIVETIFEFDVAGTEVAYLDVYGQAL
jgi:hypothetical protein